MGQRVSSATVEFISATRLHPPLFETADTVVAAPPEVTRSVRTNVMTRLLPVVMAIATVGMMAVVFLSRSGVARNPVFMTFPLMMLLSAVAAVVSGADRQRGEINAAPSPRPLRHSAIRWCGAILILTRCGRWWAAAGCGNGDRRTQTFATFGSVSEHGVLPPVWCPRRPGPFSGWIQ
jgi:hypothetical protein